MTVFIKLKKEVTRKTGKKLEKGTVLKTFGEIPFDKADYDVIDEPKESTDS